MRTRICLLLCAGLMVPAGGRLLAGDARDASEPSPLAYRVTDLGTLGGDTSGARSINNRGQIVGASKLPYSVRMFHACLWDHGKKIDLGALAPQQRQTYSYANDINDKGQVVGMLVKPLDNDYLYGANSAHAVLWDHGKVIELLAGQARTQQTQAFAINRAGVIVGQDLGSHPGAFLYATGKLTHLDPGSNLHEEALGINDAGVIVGSDGKKACLWDHGKKVDLGVNGFAAAINDRGEVVGSGAAGSKPPRAFRWRNGQFQDLGTLGGLDSFAYSINASGQIVGESERSNKDPILQRYAFLYTDGKMVDLTALLPPHSGWKLISANHINDRGQIVGSGTLNDVEHAYLLTPVSSGSR